MDYSDTAKQIVEKVGGMTNISSIAHCMTRLRLILKDAGVPKDTEVENIPGVLGILRQGGQYQIIIGIQAGNVYKEVLKLQLQR